MEIRGHTVDPLPGTQFSAPAKMPCEWSIALRQAGSNPGQAVAAVGSEGGSHEAETQVGSEGGSHMTETQLGSEGGLP